MDWTEELIARLRALWADGHSTAEIGRRMGISKNAVVGKAHRLELAARPSPIQRGAGAASRSMSARRPARPALPPTLPRARLPEHVPAHVPERAAQRPAAAPRPIQPAFRSSARTMPCCWPIGEPGSANFRFCDEPAISGKPYCEAHVQLAYVKARDRRDDAA